MANNEMQVERGLDLERYMGRWYEIASFPSRNQPKDGVNTRATYTLRNDGTVQVLNETWSNGKRGHIEGTAFKSNRTSDEAKFKVKFYIPPFLPIIPINGDYWVLFTDDEYQYALIGQPSRNYLWVSKPICLNFFFKFLILVFFCCQGFECLLTCFVTNPYYKMHLRELLDDINS